MPLSTDAILFCLRLFFPIVCVIYLSRHAISSSVGHAFDCVYKVSSFPPCDLPVVLNFDDMCSPCIFRLVHMFYDIPFPSLLSYPHGSLIFPCDVEHYSFMGSLHGSYLTDLILSEVPCFRSICNYWCHAIGYTPVFTTPLLSLILIWTLPFQIIAILSLLCA